MKDCTSCPHRVALNPHFADMDFDDIPCATCRLLEPHEQEPKNLAQIHLVETRNKETLGTGFMDIGDHCLPATEAAKLSHKAKTLSQATWIAAWEFAHTTTYSEQQFLFQAVHKFSKPEWALLRVANQRGFTVSQTSLAKELGITKQAVNATIEGLCKKVPSIKPLMQKQKRGKA